MSVLSPRNKLVSFRLSEREYEMLQALCVSQRARSLSDFVREVMQMVIIRPEARMTTLDAPETSRMVFEMPSANRWRPGLACPVPEQSTLGLSGVTDMLLRIQRRTEFLEEQVSRLVFVLRQNMSEARDEGGFELGLDDVCGKRSKDPTPAPPFR
ncbi:MAG: hypothetical protein M1274_01465 [Actinobacteria bacterium]|nr:hypothetical protein [Actinomycetota bacterium]